MQRGSMQLFELTATRDVKSWQFPEERFVTYEPREWNV